MSTVPRILVPLPAVGFDPTECAVPWQRLTAAGIEMHFATPAGRPAAADPRMVTGEDLGLWAPILRANGHGRAAYASLLADSRFLAPLSHDAAHAADFDALMLPGGHAPGMKVYLESAHLQSLVAKFFASGKPVAAICHGVLLAARARRADGRSVLHGRRTTALPEWMELSAWRLTRNRLGDYYRTYPVTVQQEVSAALAGPDDFIVGPHWSPRGFLRDTPDHTALGFTVRDGNYLSARWPGDAHRFADELLEMLRR
ncbi:MAG TPA: type 1 glutamine amidotransferase domain-containing protein [Rhodocyclaceae bacterium]|nr:type 1 glutamine amidotransferase domain-containing protein [Rhodocyclaceae bacterium]